MAEQAPLILNVNDTAATRYLMTHILKSGGYRVSEVDTGEAALQFVAHTRPDLVLLDVKLPGIDGLEVCRRLKADPSTASMLVVQTSATYASSDRRVAGLNSGADAYLPQPVEAGELLATIGALLRLRRAEEGERRLSRRLKSVFDAMHKPLLVLGSEGVIVDLNQPALGLMGVGREQLIGRDAGETLGDFVKAEALAEFVRSAHASRQVLEVGRSGRTYCLTADPVKGDDGDFEGTLLLIDDISERKELERQLRARVDELDEASRRKDDFLNMLAHELRNPLHAISAATSVLDHEEQATNEQMRLRGVIHQQTRRLARLVDDLLEVSRLTRGVLQLRREPVDLVASVRQALSGVQGQTDGRRQPLMVNLPTEPVMIEGDELRLDQIVVNLVSNASKFSEAGSPVRITLRTVPDGDGPGWAELRVRDEGVGIPVEMLGKIFDPFVQIDQSLARSLGGLGIGLSLVKSLIDMHGGQVEAHSAGAGRGAEFIVRLPLRPDLIPPSLVTVPPKSSRGNGPKTGLRILVVEDNEDSLELLQMWLGRMGHTVEGADDGLAGADKILSWRPDVALVDIGLPELDGYGVAERVRANPLGSGVFMVALTGYGRPEDRRRALAAGFDEHVVKPIDEATLRRVLHHAQRRRPQAEVAEPTSMDERV